ncbi:UDP-glucuronic acid decarboxylase family protein [Vreelandella venusta]|uniref:UDP-glucuronic acid decarboxylase family protein n=1 Tax=Vreelandella venusta TaxID=44935 RepID=UPI00384A4DD7
MSSHRFIVTGGAGFLGARLIDRLLFDGHAVVCIDNLSTGRRANLAKYAHNPAFSLIVHDVTQPLGEYDLPACNSIFHLACPASPVQYQADPVHTTRTAVLGTLNMLELAQSRGIPLLLASTSEVYGNPAVHPQPEHYWGHVNPIGPRACYDEGKRCAESLCFDYARHRGVEVKIARIFNTYGPGMQPDDGRVVSNLIIQALQERPLTLYGDGQQTRSFCYVDDLIEGLIRLMAIEQLLDAPVNLGNPDEISVRYLAEQVLKLTGSRSPLIYHPLPDDDPQRRCPDISRARQLLGWQPHTPLVQGLHETINAFKNNNAMYLNGERYV